MSGVDQRPQPQPHPVLKQYVWGPPEVAYIDELCQIGVNQDPNNATYSFNPGYTENECEYYYFALQDANYNVLGVVTDAPGAGRLVERYEYTPYGQRTAYSHGIVRGDVTGDGYVGSDDLSAVLAKWNQNLTGPDPADLNGDGFIGLGDQDIVQGNWNAGLSPNFTADPSVTHARLQSARFTSHGAAHLGPALCDVGHQGLMHDEEFGAQGGLINNRARTLHPRLGRFMQRDPLGYVDGMNVYSYYSALHGAIDPTGLLLAAFDGTENDPSDETNVWAFWESYAGPGRYLPGVGVDMSLGEVSIPFYDVAGALWGLGTENRVDSMYEWFTCYMSLVSSPDRNIDIIGFSRGAAAARAFANKLVDDGFLSRHSANIRFIGIWDTVPSLGVSHSTGGYNLDLPAGVTNAFHALSLDEERSKFALERYQGATEVWFPGAHSDVGGGYDRGERGLSNTALRWMLHHGRQSGAPIIHHVITDDKYRTTKDNIVFHWPMSEWKNWLSNQTIFRTVPKGDMLHISSILAWEDVSPEITGDSARFELLFPEYIMNNDDGWRSP